MSSPKDILPKTYNAKDYEDAIYKKWESSGFFNPDNAPISNNKKTEKFSISIPPPNATGELHLGHAMMLAIQDLLIRYHRMKGKATLWLPGQDHAAIATQTKVEKILQKEGKTKYDLGRDKFLKRVEKYVADSRDTIRNQLRKMGSSCDWSRERYTMDKGLTKAVQTVFIKMYNDGLVYRGNRIVNWCPRCGSTLADDEVEYREEKTKLWTFRYDKNFPIEISTTRPETKIGDSAVAVNPKDKRYKKYIGKLFDVDFLGKKLKIKIIGEGEVDMEYGTGALGVTPAHSAIDFEMGKKNNLAVIKVIGEDGKMTSDAGKFAGMKVVEARKKIVDELKKKKLLSKEENLTHELSICYRCGAAIEPLTSLQWFINVNKPSTHFASSALPSALSSTLRLGPEGKAQAMNGSSEPKGRSGSSKKKAMSIKERAIEAVKNGEIKFIPSRFEKTYYHWMENLRDWCISRQIWFGHRIPVYYRKQEKLQITNFKLQTNSKTNEEIYVGIEPPKGKGWVQDPDTLDTWFSSGLWTFSTLGWPEATKRKDYKKLPYKRQNDLERFHPTSVMETGYDILFFWIARMIIMSTYALGEIPFKTVYLHGLVRDKQGRKMSKSLGNGIDPLDVIEKYGADATRLSLLIGVTPGNDVRLYDEKIAGYRNFVNKLWNIARFILHTNDANKNANYANMRIKKGLTLADKWILSEMNKTIKNTTKAIEDFQFSKAGELLYEFTWTKLADWYLEISKIPAYAPRLRLGASADRESGKQDILIHILINLLKLWHPFTPYVTEQIWSSIKNTDFNTDLNHDLLIIQKWPEVDKKLIDAKSEKEFSKLQKIVSVIRNLRAEHKIEPREVLGCQIASKQYTKLIKEQKAIIEGLARVKISESKIGNQELLKVHGAGFDVGLAVNKEIDKKKAKKEITNLKRYVEILKKKLGNKEFLKKAPREVVEKERKKLKEASEKLEKMDSKLDD